MKKNGDVITFETKAELEEYNKGIAQKAVEAHEKSRVPAAVSGNISVGETNPHKTFTNNMKGLKTARMLRMLAVADNKKKNILDVAKDAFEKSGSDVDGAIVKALTVSEASEGGSLVHEQFANEIIELLRGNAVVRSMAGVRFIPMPNGNITFDKLTSGAVVAYRSENNNANVSTPQTAQVKLSAKELVGIVAISNKLMNLSDYAVDVLVRDDLAAALAEREDVAFLRGDGADDTPTGILNRMHSTHKVNYYTLGATPSVEEVRTTLSKLRLLPKSSRIPMRNPGWIISPRVEEFLMSLTDGNGNPVYEREMVERKTIGNAPFAVSNQIPENLDAGSGNTDGAEIYYGDFSQLLIGDTGQTSTEVIPNAAYDDGEGNIVSGVSKLQTVVRIVTAHDIGVRYDKAFALGRVRWGA